METIFSFIRKSTYCFVAFVVGLVIMWFVPVIFAVFALIDAGRWEAEDDGREDVP